MRINRTLLKAIYVIGSILGSLALIVLLVLIADSQKYKTTNVKYEEIQDARYVISSAEIKTESYRRDAINAQRVFVDMFCITYVDGHGNEVAVEERLDEALPNIKVADFPEYVVYKTYASKYSDDVAYNRQEEYWKQRCEYYLTKEMYDEVFSKQLVD